MSTQTSVTEKKVGEAVNSTSTGPSPKRCVKNGLEYKPVVLIVFVLCFNFQIGLTDSPKKFFPDIKTLVGYFSQHSLNTLNSREFNTDDFLKEHFPLDTQTSTFVFCSAVG